jgi:hypothetical protein
MTDSEEVFCPKGRIEHSHYKIIQKDLRKSKEFQLIQTKNLVKRFDNRKEYA